MISQSALASFALVVFASSLVLLPVSFYARPRLRLWATSISTKQVARLEVMATNALTSIRDEVTRHLGHHDSGVAISQFDPGLITERVATYTRPMQLVRRVRARERAMKRIMGVAPYLLVAIVVVSFGTGLMTIFRSIDEVVLNVLAGCLSLVSVTALVTALVFFLCGTSIERVDAVLAGQFGEEEET